MCFDLIYQFFHMTPRIETIKAHGIIQVTPPEAIRLLNKVGFKTLVRKGECGGEPR